MTGASTYTPCSVGYFSSIAGSTFCNIVPAGSYASNGAFSGSISAIVCPSGYFTSSAGSTACVMTPAGSYSYFASGSTGYTSCAANTYSAAGVSVCTACLSTQFSNPGATVCLSTFSPSFVPSLMPSPTPGAPTLPPTPLCPSGQYLSGSSCVSCVSGSYSGPGQSVRKFIVVYRFIVCLF